MRKLVAGLVIALLLAGGYGVRLVNAGITCTLPFQLQNNTTADATQVMANYNALVTCFTNAAAAGVNSDITALTALVTPLTPAQGGSTSYWGGTSGGSANAQTIAVTLPTGFTLATGKQLTFIAGFTNTAAVTLNVNALGVKAVQRPTQVGASASVGGEFNAGQTVTVVYDGTQYQLVAPISIVGELKDYAASVAPSGWAIADNACVSQTTYPALFTVLATSWGSCGGGLFALPDARGRMTASVDGGTTRLTAAGCAGSLAIGCGSPTTTIAKANLPVYNLDLSLLSLTGTNGSVGGRNTNVGTTNEYRASDGTGGAVSQTPGWTFGAWVGTLPLGGSGTAVATIPALIVVTKIVKL